MNWSLRYANENDFLHLLDPHETGEWSFVGGGGSIYTKRPDGLILKTLHPLAYEGYKTMRPGMYSHPSQMYTGIAFEPEERSAGGVVLPRLAYHNNIISNNNNVLLTMNQVKHGMQKRIDRGRMKPNYEAFWRRMLEQPEFNSKENQDKLYMMNRLSDDIMDIVDAPKEKVNSAIDDFLSDRTWPHDRKAIEPVDRKLISYKPAPGYSVHNWGRAWFGTDPEGIRDSKSGSGGHMGHSVEAVFDTPEEAQEYAMSPENVDRYRKTLMSKEVL